MKTLDELEKITGLSYQQIYGRLKRNNVNPKKVISGKNYYDESVIDFLNRKKTKKYDSKNVSSDKQLDDFLEKIEWKNIVEDLRNQLKIKDEQIKKKDEQIEKLQLLLSQEQQLHLMEKKKIESSLNNDSLLKGKTSEDKNSDDFSKNILEKSHENVDKSTKNENGFFKKFLRKIKKK